MLKRPQQEYILTENAVGDLLFKLQYKKLSREQEISFIKKAKLSFYDEVNDQEKSLFLKYYMEEFPQFKLEYENASSEEKNILLATAIENSKQYADMFIENNQFLLAKIAHEMHSKKMEYSDMFSIGNIALIDSLRLFDVEKGNKFSSYATSAIKNKIDRHMREYENTITISIHYRKLINIYKNFINDFEGQHFCPPTEEEIIKNTCLTKPQIDIIKNYIFAMDNMTSLDKSFLDEDDGTLGDYVLIDDIDVAQEYVDLESQSYLRTILESSSLTDRDRLILYMRYGFNQYEPMSGHKIAQQLQLPVASVYFVINRSLKILRRKLYEYDDERKIIFDNMNYQAVKQKTKKL